MGHKFNPGHAAELHQDRRGLDLAAIIAEVGVGPGESLLDLGAGSGHFTLALANAVGPEGQVIAADVSEEMLETLRTRLQAGGWTNVKVVPSQEQSVPLTDACCERAFLVDVLHEADDPAALLGEAARVVHRGGQVIVVDWAEGDGPPGPPAGDRISEARARDLLAQAGLTGIARLTSVTAPHYGLIARWPEPGTRT